MVPKTYNEIFRACKMFLRLAYCEYEILFDLSLQGEVKSIRMNRAMFMQQNTQYNTDYRKTNRTIFVNVITCGSEHRFLTSLLPKPCLICLI